MNKYFVFFLTSLAEDTYHNISIKKINYLNHRNGFNLKILLHKKYIFQSINGTFVSVQQYKPNASKNVFIFGGSLYYIPEGSL